MAGPYRPLLWLVLSAMGGCVLSACALPDQDLARAPNVRLEPAPADQYRYWTLINDGASPVTGRYGPSPSDPAASGPRESSRGWHLRLERQEPDGAWRHVPLLFECADPAFERSARPPLEPGRRLGFELPIPSGLDEEQGRLSPGRYRVVIVLASDAREDRWAEWSVTAPFEVVGAGARELDPLVDPIHRLEGCPRDIFNLAWRLTDRFDPDLLVDRLGDAFRADPDRHALFSVLATRFAAEGGIEARWLDERPRLGLTLDVACGKARRDVERLLDTPPHHALVVRHSIAIATPLRP